MILGIEHRDLDIRISYVENKERKIVEVPKDNLWYWKESNRDSDSTFKSYLGKPVSKHYYTNTRKSKVDKFSIWEWINASKEYRDSIYKLELPKVLFCDIETEVIDGFPNPSIAKEAITVISFSYIDNNDNLQSITAGYKEHFNHEKLLNMQEKVNDYYVKVNNNRKKLFKYKKVDNEEQLLRFFVEICKKFHVLTGWNFEFFDWPFLKNRMTYHKIDYKSISPSNTLDKSGKPTHFVVIDYMALFDKNDRTIMPKESIALEWISTAVLGVGKLKYECTIQELYEQDYEKYVLYCAIDTMNVALIHDTCKTLNALVGLATRAAVEISKCQSPTAVAEGAFSKYYYDRNLVIPIDYNKANRGEYEGAYVRDPIIGMHYVVSCFDFSSLYPSIARMLNLSPESILDKVTPDIADLYGKENSYDKYKELSNKIDRSDESKIISVNGCVFSKEISVLRQIFDDLYADRKNDQYRYKLCDKLAHELKQKVKSMS